jgi:hypothetical protein
MSVFPRALERSPGPRADGLRRGLLTAGALAAAVVFGALVGASPLAAAGLAGVAALVALAFLAPAAHLTLLVTVTAIVPYGFQNSYGVAGAGLIVSDVLLLGGLARTALVLVREPLDRRRTAAGALLGLFLVLVAVQAVQGFRAGAEISVVGYELRSLAGWSVAFIAYAVLADAGQRARLLRGLLGVGIVTGLWGIYQYFGPVPFSEGQAGLREGVRLTTEGKGQVQGALFAFPCAVLISLAVLTLGGIRSRATRGLLVAVLLLNAVALLFTYERTFWVATALGCVFITLKAGWSQRFRTLLLAAAVLILAVPIVSTVAPGALVTARERLLSLGQYSSDDSVRARVQESRVVVDKIAERPLTGWGLGDEVHFGMPWLQVPPSSDSFVHNEYLWLTWKLGVLGCLALILLLGWAILARPPPGLSRMEGAVRVGAQAALLAMLVIAVTFPSLRALSITVTLGLLLALCLGPSPGGRPAD